jgi:hypothetical protein
VLFPEFLFQLSARDQQVTWLDPLITDQVVSAALTTVDALIRVPDGRCLILTTAVTSVDPGAGQNFTAITLALLAPGPVATANVVEIAENRTPGAADANFALAWSGAVLVPPGWAVLARNVFNSGVAANVTRLNITGMLIPVGNIQRV